jgi:RHS repeat-associated protein
LEESGEQENPYRYGGYRYDEETRLYYLTSRYYDPRLARFISEDSYRGNISDPLSLNLYVYCDNNPLIYLEPVQPEAVDMNPYILKAEYGADLCFWGGLGNQRTAVFSSPAEIRAEIKKLRREMSRGGGYVLAPCKPLNISVPVENALAIIDEFSKFNF